MLIRLLFSTLAATACFGQSDREMFLLDKVAALEARIAALEKRLEVAPVATVPTLPPAEKAAPKPEPTSWMKDTAANLYFDGYYAWNTNRPLGRVNLLRAYDVTANNLSINQTGLVLDRAPNADRRWGYRLDLMFGQATETLQGGAQNEPRPQVYRHLFQAYGTYVAPIHKGLTVDFASGPAPWVRRGTTPKNATLPLNERVSLTYWLVNGANQTEDFNGFKSQLGQAVIKPTKNITWTLNYYNGREQRDPVPAGPTPRGGFHVIDTYAVWNATQKLTLGGEFDYVANRVKATGPAQVVAGAAGYLRYQLTGKAYFGQRYTRLNDRAGLFSGASQNLNEVTSTLG